MNQYHIFEAIGRGKHSTVYKGRKKKTIEYFAIKSVDKSQKHKVLQEVRTLHSLEHPNVLKFYAWYETSAHLWLVLEYCVGGDLLTLLRQDNRLPEESIHDFARDLVHALQFLHSKGVIYCDLKPSNILLDENGRLKLCDFGLARRLSDISKNSVSQLPQAKRGTPCYMAPELFQEGGVHSFASDLWALGCVLYECSSGRPPFVANEFTHLVKSILSDATPPLPNNTSKEFRDLVHRLLLKDPAERIQWPEIRKHPFWKCTIEALSLPPQPAFNNLLQLASKSSSHTATERDHAAKNTRQGLHAPHRQNNSELKQGKGPLTPANGINTLENIRNQGSGVTPQETSSKHFSSKANGVNLLRLSKIVKSNFQRETEGENYRRQSSKKAGEDDLKIENHDQELDFAENADSDQNEENDTSEASVPTTPLSEAKMAPNARSNQQQDDHDLSMRSPNSTANDCNDSASQRAKAAEETLRLEPQEVAATPPGIIRRFQRLALGNDTGRVPAGTDPSKVSVHISQALWHPSDLSVKPIMLSRKHDKFNEPDLNARLLPFECLPSADFLKLSSEQLDEFVIRIVASINGNTSLTEKQNAIRYIESISSNVDAANIIVNSPIMPTLVKMFRISKNPALRIQLVYVIGLLIRHATIVEDEVASTGIISALTDGLRDKQERVRRFAMAALGELLFYISTQSENSPKSTGMVQESPVKEGRASSGPWQVPNALIGLISSTLRKGEDDATQLYALKTIENIASQGGDWSARFTNSEVVSNLCYIFRAPGKQESLRLTAGSCLVRLLRFSPPHIQLVLDKLTFKELVAGLGKNNPREQQISINLINMALLGSNMVSNMSKHVFSLLEDKALVPSLVSLLEQAAEALRGKVFVCAALLCKINRRWLPSLCNAKVLPAMERLTREKDAYVQQCMETLVQTVANIVPTILDSINSDLKNLSNTKRLGVLGTPQGGRSQARSNIHFFPVLFHLFNSPVFMQRLATNQVLQHLAKFMKNLETPSFPGRDEFQSNLLRILEIVGQEPSIILENEGIFIIQVLPSLAILYKNNADADARFLCLKILFDVLLVFLNDTTDPSSNPTGAREQALKSISENYFLPLYPTFIEDEDPIPMFAQKLLVMLLDLKYINISDIIQLKLLSQVFEFLSEDLANANVNNVRLCVLLASSQEVETNVFSDLQVVKKIGALLEFVTAKEMEDFLEPTLCLCRCFLLRSSGKSKLVGFSQLLEKDALDLFEVTGKDAFINDINDLESYVGVFLELCGYPEPRIANLASECLFILARLSKDSSINLLTNLSSLAEVLKHSSDCQDPSTFCRLQSRLLYAVLAACKEYHSAHTDHLIWISRSDLAKVQLAVSKLKNSNNPGVAGVASNVSLELRNLAKET